jgi:hypothetical protein
MINSLRPWRSRWRAFFHPIDPEKAALLRARWESLPPELKTHNQVSGKHLTHCGFITGASFARFAARIVIYRETADGQTEVLFAEILSKLGGMSTMTTDSDPLGPEGKRFSLGG